MDSRQKALLALALALTAVGSASAGPNNGTVVGGSATIRGGGTSAVVVNQTSQNAIINWQTFNIGNGETVQILMPNSNSAELDRVTGNLGASQIFGSLSSNGQVFLVNPNGILFGQGAKINVGGLLATTNNISNADFMAGRYNFTIPGNPSASVVNQGTITAQTGGFAALVAPGVRNTGTISAWLGRVGLSSANTFALDLYGDRLIQLNVNDSIAAQVIDVSTGKPLKSLVGNEGTIKANGGRVELTAVAARQVVDSVINNSGVIEANSIGTRNGMIVLSAATAGTKPAGAPAQTVTVSGTLSAAGRRAGTTGGTVVITGENIALNGATINASGANGGGAVLIGGDWGGGNPNKNLVTNQSAYLEPFAVPNASTVSIDAGTTINASATAAGNGGKVVVWSDFATAFYGTILAQGGAQGGNGGFVETSGGMLAFTGTVNTSAPNGKTGTWLLDPTDLIIDQTAANAINSALGKTSVMLQTFASGLPSGPPGTTGNTNSNGNGDIIINAPISWSSNSTLTLDAYNAIVFNASINVMGAGHLALTAAPNLLAPAAPLISFNNGASVQFTGTEGSGQSLTINGQPYTLLYSMSELQNINNNLSVNYALALPLNASGVTNWTPIGTNSDGTVLNSGNGFTGSFQGLGNAISNLTINLPSASNVGLFGVVGLGGVVENVGLISTNVTGANNVGSLIGLNGGTVIDAYANGPVNANILSAITSSTINAGGLVGLNYGSIANSYASSTVGVRFAGASTLDELGMINAGGLVGGNAGSIANSYANGAVSVNIVGGAGTPIDVDVAAGGLVGNNGGSITSSFAGGAVSITGTNLYADMTAGGLVGSNFAGSIAKSYAFGAVGISLTNAIASDDTGVNAGGLVGYNNASIANTYATGLVSTSIANAGPGVTVSSGDLVGYNDYSGSIANSYWDTTTGLPRGYGSNIGTFSAIGLATSQFGIAANFSGWNFGTTPGGSSCASGGACWVIVDGDGSFNNAGGAAGATRPMLLSEWSTTITNPHQLQLMALNLSANYTLANNVNLGPALSNASDVWGPNGSAGFVPIGNFNNFTNFTGTFNGQGNTISNLVINSANSPNQMVGLFGSVGSRGVIENVGLIGGNVTGGNNGFSVGELVGYNAGTISQSYATGVVTGSTLVGGLVGWNSAGGTVSQSYTTGTVSGSFSVGGLVGENDGAISQSYATGAMSGGSNAYDVGGLVGLNTGTISQSYATGRVSGSFSVGGGLVGLNYGNVTQSYATGTVSGGDFSYGTGGLVGSNSLGGSITQSYATGAVTVGSNSSAGGLVGDNSGGSIASSYATGAVIAGANSFAGGLAGDNAYAIYINNGITVFSGGGSITNSYATGAVSSTGINVSLGGLVGFNEPGSVITNSQAYGAVTSTANLSPDNNNCSTNCQYVNVGGFVGQNYGTITGASWSWSMVPTACAASFSCAAGNVSVGSLGQGGGFAGQNQGIINFAFAIGNVSGAAGLASTNGKFNNQTQLGGFVGDSQGLITNAFATGTVGTANTPYLGVGGFAGSNEGTISTAFASGAVLAGDNSLAGGFVGSNSPNGEETCPGCFVGDGFNYYNTAAISNAHAFGNVTVGAASVVGGFASNSVNGNSPGGSFAVVTASGAVTAGDDSFVGGLVGVIGLNTTLTDSAAQNTLVASSGPNSIVGGVVGANFGTITYTTSTAPVSGVGNSYVGGVAGINLGTLSNVTADPAISGGSGDFIGGIAGLNVGSISNSNAQVTITGGPSSYVGGIAGVNGSFSNETTTIPGSSFPNGTITNSSASGTGFSSNVGSTQPPSMPALPAWLNNCGNGGGTLCAILLDGSLQPSPSPSPTPPDNTSPTQQTTQLTQVVKLDNTPPPPVITLININAVTNGGTGNTGSGGTGGTGSLASGKQGGNGAPPGMRLIDMPHMPLPPGSGLPPLGEVRFVSNELVLQFDGNLTPEQIAALATRFGLTVVAQQTIGMFGRTVYTFRLGNGQSVRDVIALINASGIKAAVQPQYTYRFTQDGNSADRAETGDPAQYIVQKLQLAEAHRISKGDNVVIAVIDSAIDAEQPDFAGRVIDRYDAGCGASAPDAHGTGMAGAIASRVQLLGVAPNAKIIAICAFGGPGGTPEATSVKIIRGLDYAVQHGAKIVNMSFAGPYDPALAQALQVAREKGVLIIAAAGNAGAKSPPLYPGADPNVIAVTATDENDHLFAGANQGKYVALAAPGVNILVPAPNGGVQMTTGTSVATANVSGVAALLLGDKPSRTPEDIRALLVATAKHLGAKGVNPQFGAGLVDPIRALQQVAPVAGKSAAAAPPGRVQ